MLKYSAHSRGCLRSCQLCQLLSSPPLTPKLLWMYQHQYVGWLYRWICMCTHKYKYISTILFKAAFCVSSLSNRNQKYKAPRLSLLLTLCMLIGGRFTNSIISCKMEMNYPALIYLPSVKEPQTSWLPKDWQDSQGIYRNFTVDSKNNINYVFLEMMTDTMSQFSS